MIEGDIIQNNPSFVLDHGTYIFYVCLKFLTGSDYTLFVVPMKRREQI